jgi:4-hydroxy-3-methylbut-2-en-1-yl diphosphate reductase
MKIKMADNYGFCFGVKRAINIAQKHKKSYTFGPLIHNNSEINRLKNKYDIGLYKDINEVQDKDTVIIRTHGIPKNDLKELKNKKTKIINATCPFVTTPQQIVEDMSKKNYSIVIFGDKNHPEVKGIKSYCNNDNHVIANVEELKNIEFKYQKIATISQTTKKKEDYLKVVNKLILNHKEVRVHNTICDATLDNQKAASKLSKEVDIMIIIGGKDSSNTKQLLNISKENCEDSFLIQSYKNIKNSWFENKKLCGITAGASTPNWIIEEIINKIKPI